MGVEGERAGWVWRARAESECGWPVLKCRAPTRKAKSISQVLPTVVLCCKYFLQALTRAEEGEVDLGDDCEDS